VSHEVLLTERWQSRHTAVSFFLRLSSDGRRRGVAAEGRRHRFLGFWPGFGCGSGAREPLEHLMYDS
jgi:hypothetical protein